MQLLGGGSQAIASESVSPESSPGDEVAVGGSERLAALEREVSALRDEVASLRSEIARAPRVGPQS